MLIEADKDIEMIHPVKVSLVYVAKKGAYYHPAESRYPNKTNISIMCDNCQKKNIIACISKDKYDICLKCCHDLCENTMIENKQIEYIFTIF